MTRALATFLVLISLPPAAAAGNLTIDNVWNQAKVIAYEFPDADGRSEAIRHIQDLRDSIKRGAELLDAAANPNALPAKLKNGFILYTTLDDRSRLLRLAGRKLGWDLTGGNFHWRDLTAATADLKLVLVAQNPYSKGYCVIFAAASNRALIDINSLHNGSASYDILQGDRILREGLYDQTFTSIERVSKPDALADVNQFFATLQRVHPRLLGKVTPESYRALKQQTADSVTAHLDSHGEIGVDDLASQLYYAAAFFHDGHTAVDWYTTLNELNTRGKRFPAFRLVFDNGHFFITAARDSAIAGMELVAVNGTHVEEFLRPILDRSSGETPSYRATRFLWNEPFWYYLTNLFGSASTYRLTLRDAQGQTREASLETLNYADYQAFRKDGDASITPNNRGIAVEFLDSGATAHFFYSSFHYSNEAKKLVDAVFQQVKAKGSRNLILDLRHNGGGDSEMAEQIFRNIYPGKFRAFSKVRAKASWDILPQVPWFARPLLFVLRGRVLGHSIAERAFPKTDVFFPGRTYLLVDNGSYSMAASFAAMFRDYDVGATLGYETGGLSISFGGPHYFSLKHSRIPCTVSWTENIASKPRPGDDRHGVIPTVPLTPQKLADFQKDQDPVLAFTLHYIHQNQRRHIPTLFVRAV